MGNKLHKRRVKLFRKMKGTPYRVTVRSERHLNQVLLAAKEVGYVNTFQCRTERHTIMFYHAGWVEVHNHDCGIGKATPCV